MIPLRLLAAVFPLFVGLTLPVAAGAQSVERAAPSVEDTAPGASLVKYSGTIAAVDRDRSTIVLAEIGPWPEDPEITLITMRTIHVLPATEFVIVLRAPGAPSGYPGDVARGRLERWQVYIGDVVTVECERLAGTLVARRIAVIDEFSR